jgi:hypothetical protein
MAIGRSTCPIEWFHHPQHHETWERRPHYSRLHLPRLRRLQRALLGGLRRIWALVPERFVAGIADMLRRWLG